MTLTPRTGYYLHFKEKWFTIVFEFRPHNNKIRNMKIMLNGQPKDFPDVQNLKEIVRQSCQNSNPVIAEINGNIVKNFNWDQTIVKDGDIIELVSFVGGG